MDNIWYRNSSKAEVNGRCGGDDKSRMTTQNRHKSNVNLFYKCVLTICMFYVMLMYLNWYISIKGDIILIVVTLKRKSVSYSVSYYSTF